MWRARHDCHAISHEGTRHRHRHVNVSGAVVDTRKNMAVKVYHALGPASQPLVEITTFGTQVKKIVNERCCFLRLSRS